ncbi:MAG: DUF4349 domain-containing protein, partial [Myxococcales bacterium]|nr:DUF4349 domain-containing protein [Myxococcales bacterium]
AEAVGPAPTAAPDNYDSKKSMADYDDAPSMAKDESYNRSEPTSVTAAPARPSGGPTGGTTPPTSIPEPKPRPSEARDGEAKPDDDPKKQFARQIIYTAELQLSVYKLEDAMQRAEQLTLSVGGYVQNMSQGYYVLRIPAPALRGVMDELAHLGVVEARTLQARDVSEEYVDLTTRIRVLRETQQQLLVLLKQARNVDEALKVRESVDRITMELEQAMGRLRLLESLIGFSTLTVRMSQRGPQNTIPSSNDPFPWVDGLGVEATEWN